MGFVAAKAGRVATVARTLPIAVRREIFTSIPLWCEPLARSCIEPIVHMQCMEQVTDKFAGAR